jgi:hypothetical protein
MSGDLVRDVSESNVGCRLACEDISFGERENILEAGSQLHVTTCD